MGRQTGFHMLPEDAFEFLAYARTKAPITCTERSSDSAFISECDVRTGSQPLCLWNHDILPTLQREYVTISARPYYRVDTSLPVIEFLVPHESEWDGVPALTQGRIWASFDIQSEPLRKWFDSLVRWIRKTFVKNPVHWQSGYVGRHAYEWHRNGGLLLPTYRPPTTDEWKERLLSQHPNPKSNRVTRNG
jgi:hypothetical protein